MKRPGLFLMALLAAGALLAACSAQPTLLPTLAPATQPPATKPTAGEAIRTPAQIDEVEILILESFPVQVNVIVRGNLPNGCATIGDIVQERSGQEFRVTITAVQPADVMCADVLVPFEETISLDVVGLKAGTYTVNVNGIVRSFELAVDNVLPTESAPPAELKGGILATFEVAGEQFRVWVTNPQTVQQILDLAAGTSSASIPNGRILRGPGSADYNLPWSWHLDPEEIEMAEMTIEACDGTPSYVEEHLAEFVDTIGRYCPWSARLVEVQVLPGGTSQPATQTSA
jgi:hypothetical protein